jgi:hypothetical protein
MAGDFDFGEDRPVRRRRPRRVVVYHAPPAGSNSFGITSLVIGLVCLPMMCIPFVNVFAIGLGCLGLLLGVCGFLGSLRRGGDGLGYAFAISGAFLLPALGALGRAVPSTANDDEPDDPPIIAVPHPPPMQQPPPPPVVVAPVEPERPTPPPPQQSARPAARFSDRDQAEALRYLARLYMPYGAAREQPNQLALKTAESRFHADLRRLAGKPVDWRVEPAAVGADSVSFRRLAVLGDEPELETAAKASLYLKAVEVGKASILEQRFLASVKPGTTVRVAGSVQSVTVSWDDGRPVFLVELSGVHFSAAPVNSRPDGTRGRTP